MSPSVYGWVAFFQTNRDPKKQTVTQTQEETLILFNSQVERNQKNWKSPPPHAFSPKNNEKYENFIKFHPPIRIWN